MPIQDKGESAGGATRRVIFRKIVIAHVIGHFEVCCKSKQTKEDTLNRDSCRFRGNTHGKPKHGRMARIPTGQRHVRQVTEQTEDESQGNKDFYVFSARSREAQNTVEILFEDQPINVTIDSGANCNLMSERIFEIVKGGNASLLECDERVYAYASKEPLQLRGKCNLTFRGTTNPQIP